MFKALLGAVATLATQNGCAPDIPDYLVVAPSVNAATVYGDRMYWVTADAKLVTSRVGEQAQTVDVLPDPSGDPFAIWAGPRAVAWGTMNVFSYEYVFRYVDSESASPLIFDGPCCTVPLVWLPTDASEARLVGAKPALVQGDTGEQFILLDAKTGMERLVAEYPRSPVGPSFMIDGDLWVDLGSGSGAPRDLIRFKPDIANEPELMASHSGGGIFGSEFGIALVNYDSGNTSIEINRPGMSSTSISLGDVRVHHGLWIEEELWILETGVSSTLIRIGATGAVTSYDVAYDAITLFRLDADKIAVLTGRTGDELNSLLIQPLPD